MCRICISLIAQLAERSAVNREVIGSKPIEGASSYTHFIINFKYITKYISVF